MIPPAARLTRRVFLKRVGAAAALSGAASLNLGVLAQLLKDGQAPIPEPHFPNRLFLFVWRNWELANTERLAAVLETPPKNVLRIGSVLGLPRKPRLTEDQLRRVYITVIRQNWHILPHEQIVQLLGWDRHRYEFTLKEDDFLWSKLGGGAKPRSQKLLYSKPSGTETRRASEIRATIHQVLGSAFSAPGEPPFEFVKELSRRRAPSFSRTAGKPNSHEITLASLAVIESASGEALEIVRNWAAFLRNAFGIKLPLVKEGSNPVSPAIRFRLEPTSLPVQESFEIQAGPNGLTVTGSDLPGLRQGVYHLQDLLEEREAPFLPAGTWRRTCRVNPRYIYPYFALYGDPLADPDIDPFPEGYLEKLGRHGVNGVWVQAVLRTLAPSPIFPEFGAGWQKRLQNLRRFVARARAYGLKIYLYINEPRAMPRTFFDTHPEVRGTPYAASAETAQEFAICTTVPKVRNWLRDSLHHVFSEVPDLGGIFAITASENLTNCFAHGQAQFCPRCSQRQGWEVVTELLGCFSDGVHSAAPTADVLAWDWGWAWVKNGPDAQQTIAHLPARVQLLSVSEWGQPYSRGGVSASVGEYSMSVVGPGPVALEHWGWAKTNGTPTAAKVQLNNTWEISAVPYIPVPNLIQQHVENLLQQGVGGLMLSWTLGGYPSVNLEVAKEYYFLPQPEPHQVLRRVATRHYGPAAAQDILLAWECFSGAFLEFPYGVVPGYSIPLQHGPANPLRLKPTGYSAGMILFPWDDLKAWLGPYTPEAAEQQFSKMAEAWEVGLEHFRRGLARVPSQLATQARKDLGIAETCYIHFRSVANQIRFCSLRDQWSVQNSPSSALVGELKQIARNEIELAKSLYSIARRDSTIGYEASNHYYYRPLDLAEKILNCEEVIRSLERQ